MFLYILYRIGQVLLLIFPVNFSYWLAERIADLHYYTSGKDRTLAINNLKNVFARDDRKTRRVARAIFRNFAKYLVEFLRFPAMGKEFMKKYVTIEGLDHLKEALANNRGALLFSGHLGNWEWGAAIVAQSGFPISAITLAHKDRNVNKFFIERRNSKGVKNIPLGGSVRKSLRILAKNEFIAILSDRDFSNNAVPVQFFAKTAFMPIGIGLLAIKSGCALVPVFIARQKDNTHKLIIEKPLEYNLTEDKDKDIKDIVGKVIEVIERYIRLYPEQWFIFDNPWKKRQ